IGLGGVMGSIIGASLMHRFSPRTLTIVFGFVILAAAVRMISGASPLPGATNFDETVLIILAVAIGLVAGTFAGIAGVGGGIVIVPSAVFFLGLAQHEAQGTSLVGVIFTSLSGTIVNLRNQRVRLADGLAVGVGGMAGSLIGSRFALGVDGRTLSFTFGLLVLFVALRTLYRGFQAQPAAA
ncbi:MAG: sulfite exporter TauE/SafE family protein, partial [Acidimicrobiia bacterium]|nr:sulfite exporter TauE/SafE family protein [Acidimicrobiia bacterium]